MSWLFGLLIIGAYLLGSVPAAYLAVKWTRGVDIRKVGTGKTGASNVLNAGPKWLVAPVALFDIGKGVLSVWVAKEAGLSVSQQVVVGMMAVAGHNWPVFLGFKSGGRGVFASLGVITMLNWKMGLYALVLPYLFAPIRQVALGVFLAYISMPFLGWFAAVPLGIVERLPVTLAFLAVSLLGIGKRLISHRNELSRNVPWGEILINRLLFDRDISDRRLWNARGVTNKSES